MTLMVLLLFYPDYVSSAVVSSIKLCVFTVIPSLFPFAVTSNILIKSSSFSSDTTAAKLFSKIFNCPSCLFPVFISGIAGGYPIGAISASEMYKNGLCTKDDAQKALSFCCLGGPSFIISAVGSSMLGNSRCGVYLYVCHIISAIATGIVLRPFFGKISNHTFTSEKKSVSLTSCLTSSLKDSTASMLSVCSCIIFFSSITAVLNAIKIDCPYITAILEMTSGVKELSSSNLPSTFLLPFISACIAFGGLSVHSQVISVCGQTDISTKPFIIGKSIHALLAFVITVLSQNILGEKTTFLSDSTSYNTSFPIFISVFLLFLYITLKKCGNKASNKL